MIEFDDEDEDVSNNSNSLDSNDGKKPSNFTPDDRVFLHPASINFSQGSFFSSWLIYNEIVRTSKTFI